MPNLKAYLVSLLVHSFTHPLTRSLTDSLTHSLSHSLTHSLTHSQFGFRPNFRTTDSLFIFQQLLHKYTKQHKKLYVGFIDYEKAFDNVWQSGMIHKLQKYGIQGKFLNVIKSMYSSIRSCVKINHNALTELFSCNKGIRKGDGLSPVLFSLFMDDLPQYF